ncbi:MAG: NAD(P)/FAD-dependent oxidoreductase [Firmicutes bacterium]|nr:NAD(P)/FAD-dependent oxidoreductase [Bacillota bacterium]
MADMKIAIIGAGEGGLVLASRLCKVGGFEVTIYEKDNLSNLSYDWTDDARHEVYNELNIPLPDKKWYFRKKDWDFNACDSRLWLKGETNGALIDYSMHRRALKEVLVAEATKYGAKIEWNTPVEGAILNGKTVEGIIVNGKEIKADLVVDSGGAHSKIREQLSKDLGFPAQPKAGECFKGFRAYYKFKEGSSPDPSRTNKVYLRHMNTKGISWCIAEDDGEANVLVGTIDKLTKEDLEVRLEALKKDNPILGGELVKGGGIYSVPVRPPAERLVANGFALIGDAGFFTIPLLGSGMASAYRAAMHLAGVLIKNQCASIENLWNYQVKCYKTFGAKHFAINVMKNWLLSAKAGDVKYLFESGILENKDMLNIAMGNPAKFTPKEMLEKLTKGITRIALLVELNNVLLKSNKAYKTALTIPLNYNEKAISAWIKKLIY